MAKGFLLTDWLHSKRDVLTRNQKVFIVQGLQVALKHVNTIQYIVATRSRGATISNICLRIVYNEDKRIISFIKSDLLIILNKAIFIVFIVRYMG